MDWSSLSCLFLLPVDTAAVPNMSLLLPQTASRFPSIDYRLQRFQPAYAPLSLIECYFYKKDWVGKTGIGFNRDCLGFLGTWGTGRTSFQSKSQSKTSSTKARIRKRRFTFRNSKWHDSFRFSRRDRSEVINSTIRMVSPKTDLFSKWTEPPVFSGSYEALGRYYSSNIGNFAHFLKHLRLRRIRKNTSMTRELGIGRIDLRFELL